jgi:hypothetical protein
MKAKCVELSGDKIHLPRIGAVQAMAQQRLF